MGMGTVAQLVMEAEKSQDLPSASWRNKKVGGVVPGQTQRSEIQGSQ